MPIPITPALKSLKIPISIKSNSNFGIVHILWDGNQFIWITSSLPEIVGRAHLNRSIFSKLPMNQTVSLPWMNNSYVTLHKSKETFWGKKIITNTSWHLQKSRFEVKYSGGQNSCTFSLDFWCPPGEGVISELVDCVYTKIHKQGSNQVPEKKNAGSA